MASSIPGGQEFHKLLQAGSYACMLAHMQAPVEFIFIAASATPQEHLQNFGSCKHKQPNECSCYHSSIFVDAALYGRIGRECAKANECWRSKKPGQQLVPHSACQQQSINVVCNNRASDRWYRQFGGNVAHCMTQCLRD